MLAIVSMDTDLDVVDAGDGLTSLREAIATTNSLAGVDEIVFDFGHDRAEGLEVIYQGLIGQDVAIH